MTFRIANVVHGRFHAFDLVRELLRGGANCMLLTNYPKNVAARFGIDAAYVRTFVAHGVASRILHRLHHDWHGPDLERYSHPAFSRWAERQIRDLDVDIVHCFSGVAEEIFASPHTVRMEKILVRGSAHIEVQNDLLNAEEARARVDIEKPSRWMIDRELREYRLADVILVLSTFARDSFIQRGVDPERLFLLPLGAELSRFRPEPWVADARLQRIRSREPLRVLMTGTFSFQKGIIDFERVVREAGSGFRFRFVGTVPVEAHGMRESLAGLVEFVPRQPQHELPPHYNWADLFLFTTIQDGFSVVLSQAQAAGLPIVSTRNCGAPDIVVEGATGWTVPIRDAQAMIERLQWCDAHREEFGEIARTCYEEFQPRDWSVVAREFMEFCTSALKKKFPPNA